MKVQGAKRVASQHSTRLVKDQTVSGNTRNDLCRTRGIQSLTYRKGDRVHALFPPVCAQTSKFKRGHYYSSTII